MKRAPSSPPRRSAMAVAIRRRLPAGLGAAVLAMALWMFGEPGWGALRHHPYFAIDELVISGHGPSLTEDAIRDWLGVRDGSSLWEASPARLRERLEAHPRIAWAAVRREFPGRFEIKVREHRPQAIAVLDELYYVDRGGAIFGPLAEGDSRDYPVITGLGTAMPEGLRTWTLRRALRLLRSCSRGSCWGGVSEIHLDPRWGVVLYPTAPAVPIVLGWRNWPEKLDRATRALAAWRGATDRLASVDVRFRKQVVAKLRQPVEAGSPPTDGDGGRS